MNTATNGAATIKNSFSVGDVEVEIKVSIAHLADADMTAADYAEALLEACEASEFNGLYDGMHFEITVCAEACATKISVFQAGNDHDFSDASDDIAAIVAATLAA
jgi:hypothetical protein